MSDDTEQPQSGDPGSGNAESGGREIFGITMTPQRIIRIAIAIVLIVMSQIIGDRQFLIWGLIASLVVVFVPTGRARYFVAGIVPYASAWFIFSFLRSFADETLFARTLNLEVLNFERWLFNGEIPTIRLQAAFYSRGDIHWWDYYFTIIHWSYFIIPHAVAVWIWLRSKREYQHYLAAMSMTLFLGMVIYFIIPTNPPWMAPEAVDSPAAPVVQRIMGNIAEQIGGGLYAAGYQIVGESNPIAAMPSLHFAVTFLLVWAARGRGLGWEIAAWFYSLSMGAALVYMGEHYVIDLIVGGMVTTYSWYATKAWLNRHSGDVEPVTINPNDHAMASGTASS